MGSYGPKGFEILLVLSAKTHFEWKWKFWEPFRPWLGRDWVSCMSR